LARILPKYKTYADGAFTEYWLDATPLVLFLYVSCIIVHFVVLLVVINVGGGWPECSVVIHNIPLYTFTEHLSGGHGLSIGLA
jgi:hypothetical protein